MKILSTLILAIAAIVSASLIANGLTGLRTGDRFVTVKGVAEREVQADLALWPLRFVATGNSLDEAREKARSSREAIMAFLDIDRIRQAAQSVSELVDSGVILSSDYGPGGPTYLFNRLNDIKPEMIAEATAAAREAAAQFARDAKTELGNLRRANQGVFQILARDQAPGVSEGQQPIKTVRVVTTVEYYLN